MTIPAGTAERFTIQVPDSWIDYDIGRQDFARQQALMRAQASTAQERRAIDDLFRQARALVRTARKRGAMAAAGLLGRFDEGLLMAFISVFGVSAPDGEEWSVTDLARQLSRPAGAEGYGERTVTSVTLPHVGPVPRITGTERVRITEDVDAVVVAMHTIIPLPGEAGRYLVVTGLSPNLPLADDLYDVFDAITGTFRFSA